MPQEIIVAPLPGRIIKVNFSAGSQISEGDTICEIESMKMENPVISPVSGVVSEINIEPEQVVAQGVTLAVIDY